jgi:hypothetical protein
MVTSVVSTPVVRDRNLPAPPLPISRIATAVVLIAGATLQLVEELIEPPFANDTDRFAWLAQHTTLHAADVGIGLAAIPLLITSVLLLVRPVTVGPNDRARLTGVFKGQTRTKNHVELPLIHSGREVGTLTVGLRRGEKRLSSRDATLLSDCARDTCRGCWRCRVRSRDCRACHDFLCRIRTNQRSGASRPEVGYRGLAAAGSRRSQRSPSLSTGRSCATSSAHSDEPLTAIATQLKLECRDRVIRTLSDNVHIRKRSTSIVSTTTDHLRLPLSR